MEACHIEKKWRRGQDSNLHILSDGGFQDRCTTIMRPLRSKACLRLYRRQFEASTPLGAKAPVGDEVSTGSGRGCVKTLMKKLPEKILGHIRPVRGFSITANDF